MKNDDTTAEDKDSRSYWGFVLWPCVIMLLYFLSAAPASKLADKGIVSVKILRICNPLTFVANRCRHLAGRLRRTGSCGIRNM
jgi:hypothetical protein